jgi:hypothetical protein
VLAVLAAFDDSHPRLRLSEVARRSGLPVSTVSRLLAKLAAARRCSGDARKVTANYHIPVSTTAAGLMLLEPAEQRGRAGATGR